MSRLAIILGLAGVLVVPGTVDAKRKRRAKKAKKAKRVKKAPPPPAVDLDVDERSVVVLRFVGGKAAAQAERASISALGRVHRIIPTRSWRKAKRRLRIKRTRAADYAKLARTVGADAVVHGLYSHRTRRVTVVVRSGRTGHIVDTVYVKLPRRWVTRRARAQIRDGLIPAVADAGPLKKPEPVVVQTPKPAPKEAVMVKSSPSDSVTRSSSGPGALSKMDAELHVGVSAWARQLRFTVQSDVPAPMQPRAYDGSPAGGARVAGAIYPMGKRGGAASGLGVAVEYDRTLGLTSRVSQNGTVHDLPTDQARWAVGLRYRLPLGSARLIAAVGYHGMEHAIDSGGMSINAPAVDYRLVGAGGSLQLPLGERLQLDAGARYLHVLEAGEFVRSDNYGAGTAAGVDAHASVSFRMRESFVLSAGLALTRIGFAFDGSGALTELDQLPDQEVGGAADTYVGGFMTAGYSF